MGKHRQAGRGRIASRAVKRVILLVDTSRAFGRGLIHGVALYNREHGRWSIYFKPHGLADPPPPWLREAGADGFLVRIGNPKMATAIRKAGVPAVDLRGVFRGGELPFVGTDNRAVARLAAEHLLERGFRHFGFCGLPRGVHPHMDELCDLFVGCVKQAHFSCSVFKAKLGPSRGEAWERQQNRTAQWFDQQQGISRWIQSLPKPVGVMACHDDRALQVLDGCRSVGALVPEEVAVISADNDEYLCELAIPPLSSIDDNPRQIGYEAAALLDRMMNGEAPPEKPLRVAPRGIITRNSTDVLAIDDQYVAGALRFIREHACHGIRPRDVVAQVPLSRVALASRFKAAVGHTIGAEIQRVQIRLVQELLSETKLPIKQVARRAGFQYVEYMTRLFHRVTGQPPAEYRKATLFHGEP